MNCFFFTIAEKLNAGQLQAPQPLTSPCSKPVPCISDINLSSLDIDRKITLLKNNKATGPDGISPKLLKLAGTAVVGPLTSLFMQSIRECRVYNNWKVARLTPVFKKDDPTEMSTYRPLSLLSVPSKILESYVADMIAKHAFSEDEALVTDNQWAYHRYTVYHRAPYSGPFSPPRTQAIYRKQLTLQRRSCMPMILPCTVLVNL